MLIKIEGKGNGMNSNRSKERYTEAPWGGSLLEFSIQESKAGGF